MTTTFNFLTAVSVLSSYSWDQGLPSMSGGTLVPLQTSVGPKITGYAPYVYVQFTNSTDVLAVSSPGDSFTFDWNFGDYYNQATNSITALTATPQSHVYLMPGLYGVTLDGIKKTVAVYAVDVNVLSECAGRHSLDWAWDSLRSDGDYPVTLNDTMSSGSYTKTWLDELDCVGKYCVIWNWRYAKQTPASFDLDVNTSVTWKQTKVGEIYAKKWLYEAAEEPCYQTLVTQTSSVRSAASKSQFVEVLEIAPTAFLSANFLSDSYTSPLSAHLTSKHSVAGSFPIEKVLWNFGDGTEVVSVVRNMPPSSDSRFIHTSALSADLLDPRNYDALVVYTRTNDDVVTFYPSVSVVSSSTASVDSASITVGPLLSVANVGEFRNLRVIEAFESTDGGKLLGIQSESLVGIVKAL